MLLGALVVFAVGAVILALGVRGRRRGKEPRCARCGFDLTGLGERAQACPECGSSLAAPKAVTTGRRRRNRAVIVAGTALLLLGVGATWWAFTHTSVLGKLPSFVVSEYTRWTGDDVALREMRKRLDAGRLGSFSVRGVVAAALNHQADHARPWNHEWGAFIEQATLTPGLVRPEDERRYLSQIVHVDDARVRPRTLVDWTVTKYVKISVRRGWVRPLWTRKLERFGFEGDQPFESHMSNSALNSGGGVGETTSSTLRHSGPASRKGGKAGERVYKLEFDVWVSWEPFAGGSAEPTMRDHREFKMLVVGTPEEVATFAPNAPGPTVTVPHVAVSPPSQWAMQSIPPDSPEGSYDARELQDPDAAQVVVYIQSASVQGTNRPAAGVAHDVYVVLDGKEVWVGTAASNSALEFGLAPSNTLRVPASLTAVDVILRPSWRAALQSTDVFDVTGGEIRIPDVPVRRTR